MYVATYVFVNEHLVVVPSQFSVSFVCLALISHYNDRKYIGMIESKPIGSDFL